jgi:hypothetical protein
VRERSSHAAPIIQRGQVQIPRALFILLGPSLDVVTSDAVKWKLVPLSHSNGAVNAEKKC